LGTEQSIREATTASKSRRQRQLLGDAVDDLDRDGHVGLGFGDLAETRLRLHRQHTGDLGWVMREVQAVASAHLDHPSAESYEQAVPVLGEPTLLHLQARSEVHAGKGSDAGASSASVDSLSVSSVGATKETP
jgi:hypothetical protein